jgi:hypothetical protein
MVGVKDLKLWHFIAAYAVFFVLFVLMILLEQPVFLLFAAMLTGLFGLIALLSALYRLYNAKGAVILRLTWAVVLVLGVYSKVPLSIFTKDNFALDVMGGPIGIIVLAAFYFLYVKNEKK